MEKKITDGSGYTNSRRNRRKEFKPKIFTWFPKTYDTGNEDNWKENVSQGYSGWHDYNLVGHLSKMRFSGVHMTVWAQS